MSSLRRICLTCASTVFGLRNSWSQMPLLERPSATRARTSRSRGLRASRWLALRVAQAGEQPRDDRRVDDALAVDESLQRVVEHRDVRDPAFEQVAGAGGVLFDQPHRIVRCEMVESTRTAAAGWAPRISSATAMPSSVYVGGIRMSTIATSGCVSATFRFNSPGVPRSPRRRTQIRRAVAGAPRAAGVRRRRSRPARKSACRVVRPSSRRRMLSVPSTAPIRSSRSTVVAGASSVCTRSPGGSRGARRGPRAPRGRDPDRLRDHEIGRRLQPRLEALRGDGGEFQRG